jgi:hypothetical protein
MFIIDACGLAKSKLSQHAADVIFFELLADFCEVVVARISEGFDRRERRQITRMSTGVHAFFRLVLLAAAHASVFLNHTAAQGS